MKNVKMKMGISLVALLLSLGVEKAWAQFPTPPPPTPTATNVYNCASYSPSFPYYHTNLGCTPMGQFVTANPVARCSTWGCQPMGGVIGSAQGESFSGPGSTYNERANAPIGAPNDFNGQSIFLSSTLPQQGAANGQLLSPWNHNTLQSNGAWGVDMQGAYPDGIGNQGALYGATIGLGVIPTDYTSGMGTPALGWLTTNQSLPCSTNGVGGESCSAAFDTSIYNVGDGYLGITSNVSITVTAP